MHQSSRLLDESNLVPAELRNAALLLAVTFYTADISVSPGAKCCCNLLIHILQTERFAGVLSSSMPVSPR